MEQHDSEYNLHELGRILDAQPSAVAGMMEMLVRKGRIVEVGADCGVCDTCGIRGHCDIPISRVKRYKISVR